MIYSYYVALGVGWFLAILGWWLVYRLLQNFRTFMQVAAQREQELLRERLNMIDNLQAAFDAAEIAYKQQTPNAKGSGTTLN